jgi:hypothetical protein
MSELDGFFSLRTPKDLLKKLESDFARLRAAEASSVDAQYAAFDFFVTAEHLPDWLSNYPGGKASAYRTYPDGALVSHVANGGKHFRVDTERHTTVKDTRAESPGFQRGAFQSIGFQGTRLVIDLEDGTTADALQVAGRVVQHWRRNVPSS